MRLGKKNPTIKKLVLKYLHLKLVQPKLSLFLHHVIYGKATIYGIWKSMSVFALIRKSEVSLQGNIDFPLNADTLNKARCT